MNTKHCIVSLIIFKIKVNTPNDSMEINKLANAYGGKVHDVKKDSIMVELTATPDQIAEHLKNWQNPLELLI